LDEIAAGTDSSAQRLPANASSRLMFGGTGAGWLWCDDANETKRLIAATSSMRLRRKSTSRWASGTIAGNTNFPEGVMDATRYCR
jgi:hypothetical protein